MEDEGAVVEAKRSPIFSLCSFSDVLESIEMMIRKKRLQWIAHCARRGESDLTWRRMRRELLDGQSGWGVQIREEWTKLGVNSVKQWCAKIEDREWLANRIRVKYRG